MKSYKYIVVVLFFVFGAKAFSQTVNVPDEQFLAFLKQNYPSTINVNNKLIVAEAALVNGAFNCANRNISDLEGIQYFTSINRLYASGNQLTKLPNISTLTELLTLHVAENQISTLPNLSTLTALDELIAYNNKLTIFPDISALYHLEVVTLYTNSIEVVPSYSTLKNLKKLNIGGNPISDLSFLKELKLVNDLSLWGLQISETPDVSNLIYLENLNLGTNYLSEALDLSTLENLEILYLNDNLFKELPKGLLKLTALTEVHLENNIFRYEALIPITSVNAYSSIFSLFPQKQVPIITTENVKFGQKVELFVELNDNAQNLSFQWFKDSAVVAKTNSKKLIIEDFKPEDNGIYYCEISTPSITGFYLQSYPTNLEGMVCIEQSSISVQKNQSCEDGNTIEVSVVDNSINRYKLISEEDTISNTSGYFSNIKTETYQVTLQKETCWEVYENLISVEDLDCSEVLITPDGDGINDSYYFEEDTSIEVFDKTGKKVAQFNAPLEWSGNGNNGKLPSGYYFISINGGKSIRMSIIY